MNNKSTKADFDKIFELCLLLVTVIAAAELTYSAYYFALPPNDPTLTSPQIADQIQSNSIIVNMIFRSTTIPIFVLIVTWLFTLMIPRFTLNSSIALKLKLHKIKRRYFKEFCWCLFGSLFVFEFIFYFAISYNSTSILIPAAALLPAYCLTFIAIWQYRKEDIFEMRRPTRSIILYTMWEHFFPFVTTYLLMTIIWGYSMIIPGL